MSARPPPYNSTLVQSSKGGSSSTIRILPATSPSNKVVFIHGWFGASHALLLRLFAPLYPRRLFSIVTIVVSLGHVGRYDVTHEQVYRTTLLPWLAALQHQLRESVGVVKNDWIEGIAHVFSAGVVTFGILRHVISGSHPEHSSWLSIPSFTRTHTQRAVSSSTPATQLEWTHIIFDSITPNWGWLVTWRGYEHMMAMRRTQAEAAKLVRASRAASSKVSDADGRSGPMILNSKVQPRPTNSAAIDAKACAIIASLAAAEGAMEDWKPPGSGASSPFVRISDLFHFTLQRVAKDPGGRWSLSDLIHRTVMDTGEKTQRSNRGNKPTNLSNNNPLQANAGQTVRTQRLFFYSEKDKITPSTGIEALIEELKKKLEAEGQRDTLKVVKMTPQQSNYHLHHLILQRGWYLRTVGEWIGLDEATIKEAVRTAEEQKAERTAVAKSVYSKL